MALVQATLIVACVVLLPGCGQKENHSQEQESAEPPINETTESSQGLLEAAVESPPFMRTFHRGKVPDHDWVLVSDEHAAMKFIRQGSRTVRIVNSGSPLATSAIRLVDLESHGLKARLTFESLNQTLALSFVREENRWRLLDTAKLQTNPMTAEDREYLEHALPHMFQQTPATNLPKEKP